MKVILAGGYMKEAEQIMDSKYDSIAKNKLKQTIRPSTATKHTKASQLALQNMRKSLNQS